MIRLTCATKRTVSQLNVLCRTVTEKNKEKEQKPTTANDILPNKPHAGCNIDHTLPALGTPITPDSDRMVPSAAAWCHLQQVHYNAFQWGANLSLVTLTFDIDIQIRLTEGPDTSSMQIRCKSVQRFRRYFILKQTNKSQTAQNNQNLSQFAVCGKKTVEQ